MKKKLFVSVSLFVGYAGGVMATPITYTATGVAAYEELVEVSPGAYRIEYSEIELNGSVTFDDLIEVHTSDKTYYTYSILEFQLSTTLDSWSGTTGMLHWESDDSYPAPQNQYPGFRELYMQDFIGWFSRFDFNEADGADYPYDHMNRWLQLPPQIEIWSDNLSRTDAAYVSFVLDAPEQYIPIPEPFTCTLFGAGLIGLAGASRKRKPVKGI